MIGLDIVIPGGYLLVFDKKELKVIMRRVGQQVARDARAAIRSNTGSGKTYYKVGGGRYRASAPGQSPASRTGLLASQIKVKAYRNGSGVQISSKAVDGGAYYGRFLEVGARGGVGSGKAGVKGKANKRRRFGATFAGTRVLEPRPFLTPAAQSAMPDLSAKVRAAVIDGISFGPGRKSNR